MGRFVLRILGPKTEGIPSVKDVRKAPMLEKFDYDAHDGRGAAYTTQDPKKAMVFPSGSAAFFFSKEPSPHVPAGWPGKTYVPLEAYTLAIYDLEQDPSP